MDTIAKLAHEVAEAAAPHADRHDVDGTFVSEGVAAAKELGYLTAPVPADLGGRGARTADIAAAQNTIARACGSTGLALAMHQHAVLAAAWRWRRGDTAVEPMLRKVADGLVVVSTGGGDWTHPTTVATPVEGGWKLNGRKHFASLSPAAGVAVTFAVIGEPAPGAAVIGFGLPFAAEGVTIDETWDAAGMRGTGSHDIVLEDVFVAEAQVTAKRTWGELDKPLLVASLHAWPVVAATYLGVADALAEAAVAAADAEDPGDLRLVGVIDAQQRTARWALDGALAALGEDPDPTHDHYVTLQQMKRLVIVAGQEISTAAAALSGGRAFARRGPVDRMIRDLRAAQYHPDPPEATLRLAGQARLAAR